MRKIKVYHKQVLTNLNNFRSYLHEKKTHPENTEERIYPLLLDRHSGIMQFPEKKEINPLDKHPKKGHHPIKEKKELQIIVRESLNGDPELKIQGDLEEGVDMLTRKVAWETFRILNLLARLSIREKHKKDTLIEERALTHLSSISLSSSDDQIEHFPGWRGSCERLAAEKILQGQPIGTYILREGDPLLQWLVDQSGFPVEGYILTRVEDQNKITDYLLLRNDRGWAFKKDDPDLDHYDYVPTLSDLLNKMA